MVENIKTLWSHEHELFFKYGCFASKSYWRFEYLKQQGKSLNRTSLQVFANTWENYSVKS